MDCEYENTTGDFIEFLQTNHSLPEGLMDLIQSYVAILGEPEEGNCENDCFVQIWWDGENENRMVECFIWDENNIEFCKVEVDTESEDVFDVEETDEPLICLKEWLDDGVNI
jgi:hypothetical protein